MKLKDLRKSKRLKQKDIAKMLNVAESTYCGYEKETSEPTLDTLCKLADFYNVNLDYLIGRNVNIDNQYTNEQQTAINLLTQLDSIYLSMTTRYIEKILDDQNRIKNIETNKKME